MSSNSDLDTSSWPISRIELVDWNNIHMIPIIVCVTLLYTVGINEDNTVILLRNTNQFFVKFVLLSVYFFVDATGSGTTNLLQLLVIGN